ncbi:MAG: hypothetical protein JNK38_15930, partial [Acidobacteria bacterium]|nr:hypothetical protein [Acidobacteriota bacterium]
MKPDYCAYPPQPADDLEFAEQQDGERVVWMVGAASVGRYVMLGAVERNVLLLIDGQRTPQQICETFLTEYGGKLSLATLTKFLTKLDQTGILAGKHSDLSAAEGAAQHYVRFKLFNPDQLFARMIPALRWIWTTEFFVLSTAMMLLTVWLSVRDWPQLSAHAERLMTDHFLAVFVAGMLVVFAHEFAHGLTCKAFGGRATEVGVLMVFYVLPALYCNVTGIHLIPQRNRRLWVIAAGVYWQLMVGAAGLLIWFAVAPETLLADVALGFALGSLVDVVFNANPLIKLDGYYFLSQWLRLPNLMDRSRAFWRGLFLTGEREENPCSPRERWIYALHGMLSVVYSTGLMIVIVVYAGGWLMNTFYLFGLLLTVGVALLFVRKPLKSVCSFVFRRLSAVAEPFRLKIGLPTRRRVVPISLATLGIVVLVMPWSASVGNYGQLVALPDRETIIRAPEAA